jgi:effector-binding domain-containing protein
MDDPVRTEQAEARTLAAITATTDPSSLSQTIFQLLDHVWPVLRAQNARTDHNIVTYRPTDDGALKIEVGVEVLGDFQEDGPVRRVATPAGEVAAVAHFGGYGDLNAAYEALEAWREANGRSSAGVSWEIYGDPNDDPTKQRTDVYVLLTPP